MSVFPTEVNMTSQIGSSSSTNAIINNGLNGIASAGLFVIEKSGNLLAPATVGYIGGRFVGVGNVGLIQGVYSGIYHSMIYNPIKRYVDRNTGEGPDQIHPKTCNFLMFVSLIAETALPIILASYSSQIVNNAISTLPKGGIVRWLLESTVKREYTFLTGIGVSIAPILVQHGLSWLNEANETSKRR
ncbi:hypothetical protein DB43_FZ00100 [Parachlamydia acanthamoebae]|nr:hypothetical protein DB43_FZ00100 [Parachlamydia acanthamoebae]